MAVLIGDHIWGLSTKLVKRTLWHQPFEPLYSQTTPRKLDKKWKTYQENTMSLVITKLHDKTERERRSLPPTVWSRMFASDIIVEQEAAVDDETS